MPLGAQPVGQRTGRHSDPAVHRGGVPARSRAGLAQPLEVARGRFSVAEGLRRQQRRRRPPVFFVAAACLERPPMPLQHLGHQGDTLAHGNVREAHQAGMLEAPNCGRASAECSGHLRHK